MNTANELLNFKFNSVSLKKAAELSFTPYITRLLEAEINKLTKICIEIGEVEKSMDSSVKNLIPTVFRKFKYEYNLGKIPNLDKREIRTLTYSLYYSEKFLKTIFEEYKELDIAFGLFESNWKDSYFIGLIDCYLHNWVILPNNSFLRLGHFIFERLKKYEGSRSLLKSFKANSRYFDNNLNSDSILGSDLALRNLPIYDAPTYLKVAETWFIYPYFSRVILAYYEKKKKDISLFLDDILIALNKHNNINTTKCLVSKLIIQANTPEYAHLQNRVKSIAFDLIGDPGVISKWSAFDKATESEKSEIKNARTILIEWLTKEFINVFFKECVNDPARKKFWLKYVKEISRIRVVGSASIKEKLRRVESISKQLESFFCKTSSSDTNAALMFIMKNYIFIEFSETGSFYAYKLSNPNAPSIDIQSIHTTNQLKITSLRKLVYWTGNDINEINDEGKLGHHENWEKYAQYWIKLKLGVNI